MIAATELGSLVADPGRLIWVRDAAGEEVFWDAWAAHDARLLEAVEAASEIVLMDPLSFPYERLSNRHRDIPLTVFFPAELSLADSIAVLHEPLFRHLTAFDHVVCGAEVWEELRARYHWDPKQHVLGDTNDVSALLARWRAERLVEVESMFGRVVGFEGDLITSHLEEYGAHQRSDLSMLRAVVRPGDHVVDVGAHIGSFTLPLALDVGETGRVSAFEAAAATFDVLAENVARLGIQDRVDCFQLAITDVPDREVQMIVADENTGSAHAVVRMDGSSATARTAPLDVWWRTASSPDVDVLKIDVEGYETGVIRGARELLEECDPILMVEVAPAQLSWRGSSVDRLEDILEVERYSIWTNTLERNRKDDLFEPISILDLSHDHRTVFDVLLVPDARSDRTQSLS